VHDFDQFAPKFFVSFVNICQGLTTRAVDWKHVLPETNVNKFVRTCARSCDRPPFITITSTVDETLDAHRLFGLDVIGETLIPFVGRQEDVTNAL
jgi:hypothetical protein